MLHEPLRSQGVTQNRRNSWFALHLRYTTEPCVIGGGLEIEVGDLACAQQALEILKFQQQQNLKCYLERQKGVFGSKETSIKRQRSSASACKIPRSSVKNF